MRRQTSRLVTDSNHRRVDSYWERARWPLQSLYFLLPMLLLYEMGLVFVVGRQGEDVVARMLLQKLFDLFSVTGYHLPGVILVVVLLSWHLVKRDPWRFEPKVYAMMWLEASLLAVPLFVFMLVLFRDTSPPAVAGQWVVPLRAADCGMRTWQVGMVFSIGAGIYEELLFRLIAIALLHMVLVDLLVLPKTYGAAGAILISAVAFSLYHFSDRDPFHLGRFLFYTVAGLYFAAVYVLRGFGIVAASHALYDVMAETALRVFHQGG